MTRAKTDPTRKSEAQPDEWTVSEHEDNGDIIIRDGDGDIIANCQVDSQGFSDTQVEANAAAIVRDHNAGPGLVVALEAILAVHAERLPHDRPTSINITDRIEMIARAALAKAGA